MDDAPRMSRLIQIIARLYPRSWRERYGEEFSALLEDLNPSAGAAFNVFTGAIGMQIRNWKYGWMVAISAALACAAFAGLMLANPEIYVSQGTLLLGQGDLDSLQEVVQHVESRMTLSNIITSEKLYLRERSRMPTENVIDLMRRNVKVDPAGQGSSTIAVVDFAYPDPQIAQRVTGRLIESFVDQGNGALRALDAASLPVAPTRSVPRLAAVSGVIGLLFLGLLSFLRRRAI